MSGIPVKKLDKMRNAKNRGRFAAGHLCGTGRATHSGHEAPEQGGGGAVDSWLASIASAHPRYTILTPPALPPLVWS